MNIIETERLLIRQLNIDDASFIFKLVNDPDCLKYIGDKGIHSVEDAKTYIKNGPMKSYKDFGFGLYLTLLKEENIPIGICGILKRDTLEHPDIGFAIMPEFRKKGYILEAGNAVLIHAKKDFGIKKVLAITQPDNKDSINTLKALKLKFEEMVHLSQDAQELMLFSIEL